MYTFTKEKIEERPILNDGEYEGTLIDIIDTVSRNGDKMFKFTWKIMKDDHELLVHDYVLPEHPREIVQSIAKKKMSTMAGIMLGAKDNQEVDLHDCLHKEARLLIRQQPSENGNVYPKIAAIKPLLFTKKPLEKKKDFSNEIEDDEIPF
jgi:hypothetical protein